MVFTQAFHAKKKGESRCVTDFTRATGAIKILLCGCEDGLNLKPRLPLPRSHRFDSDSPRVR